MTTSQPRPRKASTANPFAPGESPGASPRAAAQASARAAAAAALAQMAAGVPVGAPLRIDWPDGSTEPATLVAVLYGGAKCCVARPRAPGESRYPAPEHVDVPVAWCRFRARRRFAPAHLTPGESPGAPPPPGVTP